MPLDSQMKILVTGSSGHLGEALAHCLKADGVEVVGFDLKPSEHTDIVGCITRRELVDEAVQTVTPFSIRQRCTSLM